MSERYKKISRAKEDFEDEFCYGNNGYRISRKNALLAVGLSPKMDRLEVRVIIMEKDLPEKILDSKTIAEDYELPEKYQGFPVNYILMKPPKVHG